MQNASARSRRTKSARSNRPIRSLIFPRRTVTGLSAMICDVRRNPFSPRRPGRRQSSSDQPVGVEALAQGARAVLVRLHPARARFCYSFAPICFAAALSSLSPAPSSNSGALRPAGYPSPSQVDSMPRPPEVFPLPPGGEMKSFW